MSKKNWQNVILWVLLILMVTVFSVSCFYTYIQAKLAPMTISGLIIVMTVVQMIRKGRLNRKGEETTEPAPGSSETGGSFQAYLVQGLWMVGFMIAIALFGFFVAIPLFGIAYMRVQTINWRKSIVISAITLIVIYILFEKLLDVTLYPGVIAGFLTG
ncbi:MAG: tripartite tricarboxylate transporter TctB family protein [Pseudomonadota bacterium]